MRESHSQQIKGNFSSPVARFSVTGLEPGAQYQAGLFSYNSKGRSEPVIVQAATLRLPEKQLTQEKGKNRTTLKLFVHPCKHNCNATDVIRGLFSMNPSKFVLRDINSVLLTCTVVYWELVFHPGNFFLIG